MDEILVQTNPELTDDDHSFNEGSVVLMKVHQHISSLQDFLMFPVGDI